MILHRTLRLPRVEPLDPAALEAALAREIAVPPLRWAIVAVEGDRLVIEVTA